jgi:AraC-like DNA-binding protein
VGMSRSQLHRKLSALTGFSPNEVIRNMRLERAKQLLEQKAGNASEIAYMTGFNSPAYFAKCFKDYFGLTPSEV